MNNNINNTNNTNNISSFMTKEFFNNITNELYLSDNIDKKFYLDIIDQFMFITSLSLSNLNKFTSGISNENDSKNIIYSSIFNLGAINYENIIKNLESKTYANDLYIINVSWVQTISLSDEIDIKEKNFINILGMDYKIFIITMSYHKFFNNLNLLFDYRSEKEKNTNFLGINPIIIFKGLHLGNIINLFKLNNISLNGGSISRRHKLTIAQYRLAIFTDLLDLFNNSKEEFFDMYKENLFTSSKYDRENDSIISSELNPYISQYKIINKYLNLSLSKKILESLISDANSIYDKSKNEMVNLESNISKNSGDINDYKYKITDLKLKIVEGISQKHKASLTGRIKNIRFEIDKLTHDNEKYRVEISGLNKKISGKLNELNKSKMNLDIILKNMTQINSEIIKVSNNNTKSSNSQTLDSIGKRHYHFLTKNKYRNFSTLNLKNKNRGFVTSIENKGIIKKLNLDMGSPIFLELLRILNNSPLDVNTQTKIEQFLINQGSILLKKRMDQNLDLNYYKINPNILAYLNKSIGELEKILDNYRENLNTIVNKNKTEMVEFILISHLNNEVIISQLLGRLLRIISNNNLFNKNTNCTELAEDLGQSLVYSFYSQEYNKWVNNFSKDTNGKVNVNNKNTSLSQFINKFYLDLSKSISDPVLINMGLKLLNFLEEVNLMYTDIYVLSKDHKNHIYVANPSILELIGKNSDLLSISYKIPMIVKPKDYGRDLEKGIDILGGYLLNDKEYVSPLIIKNSELKEQSYIKNKNIIFEAANNLSSVGYKINTAVLEFILDNGLIYDLFTDFNFKHPLEIKKNKKQKLTLLENKILDGFLSRKQLEKNILGLAFIFKNVPEFFIPVRIDNRGRIYCMADYLNYQGIELAKSLLLFSKGEKINKSDKQSIDYLKIFGANCFGNGIDKKSYIDRVEWVNKNEEDILNFRNGNLIKKADSKLLFIAFCFEYIHYYNSLFDKETSYISYFPIQLDATCNGYQHLSLLTGDEPLAGQLNLISGDENSIPEDFYSFVGIKINDYLKQRLIIEKQNLENLKLDSSQQINPIPINSTQKVINNEVKLDIVEFQKVVKIIESCERLLKLNKNRTLVKLPIMVKPYNASFIRLAEYVKENLNKITLHSNNIDGLFETISKELNSEDKVFFMEKSNKNNPVVLTNFDLNLFIYTLEKVISNEFPKLKEFNLYLSKVADICSILKISITWVLPTGLNVNQNYVDSEAIRLKPFKFRKNTFSLKVKTNKINKGKQKRALMPNLIHSLDAASLCLILDMFYQQNRDDSNRINFFAIHDCFAVTANNIVKLIKIIKLVYIKIYSDNSYLKKFDDGIINNIKLQYGNDSFNDETKIITINDIKLEYPSVEQVIIGKIKASKIMSANSIIN
uniref:DNA-directed RNA polymerase n=1 Tax=Calocybe gangraenosa TaxID=2725000 RepID=A0A8F1AD41_9AGAR|nr:RNA polymerase [Calocybe gangraenosa]